jgi:hypothetical protein
MIHVKLGGQVLAGISMALGVTAAGAGDAIGEIGEWQGDVFVYSDGPRYVHVQDVTQLNLYDRVLALEYSRATITMKDGCVHELRENAMVTLTGDGLCRRSPTGGNPLTTEDTTGAIADDAQAGERAAISQMGATPSATAAHLSWVPLAAVGVVAVLGAAADTGDDGFRRPPLSP